MKTKLIPGRIVNTQTIHHVVVEIDGQLTTVTLAEHSRHREEEILIECTDVRNGNILGLESWHPVPSKEKAPEPSGMYETVGIALAMQRRISHDPGDHARPPSE